MYFDFFYLYNRFASELLKQTAQKRLRGIWQHQRNVSYCLFGSKKHLMTKLFQIYFCFVECERII